MQSPPVHEQPPKLPWLPALKQPLRLPKCQPIVRDGYSSIQVNVDLLGRNIIGDAANESSIAIDPTNPRRMAIGWRQFDSVESDFRQAGWAYSHDGGHTWVFRGSLSPGTFSSDPVLDSSPVGVFHYYGIPGRLNTSFDQGYSWPRRIAAGEGDKPWMVVDPTPGPGSGSIYVVWRSAGLFGRSLDVGSTFSIWDILEIGQATDALTVTPDGTLCIFAQHLEGNEIGSTGLMRSQNAWDPQEAPVFDQAPIPDQKDPCLSALAQSNESIRNVASGNPNPGGQYGQLSLASDHSGTATRGNIYRIVPGSCGGSSPNILFSRTADGGDTWTELKSDIVDGLLTPDIHRWFVMISVALNGRIDVVWNDTRNGGGAPNLSETYYSYSLDAGDTWSTNVPVSPQWDSWVGWPFNQSKIGDYYHMRSDALGVNVAYAATFNGEQDVYFLRIGPWDCNANEIPDEQDITASTSLDCNNNQVPDECEYRGDFNGDALTDLSDIAALQNCFTGHTAMTEQTRPVNGAARADGASPISNPCCSLFDVADPPTPGIDVRDFDTVMRVFSGP